jgi:hypothetical protein
MAQSKVDIANSALVKIGAEVILSFDDDSKEAQVVKARYDSVRRIVLRMHPWNCATKRTTTSALSTTPDFGWTYQHQLPVDCLRILAVNEEVEYKEDEDYRIEGRKILADSDEIELKYIYDLEDTNEMDALFAEALAAYLAADIAYSLTQDMQVRENMMVMFRDIVRVAKTADAQEDGRLRMDALEWTESRYGYGVDRSGR